MITRQVTSVLRVAGLASVAGLLAGCSLFAGNGQNEAVQAAVRAAPAPEGWTEPAPQEVACATVNLDCQEVSARRVFHTDGGAATACEDVVSYVGSVDTFVEAVGVRGTAEAVPSVQDCTAELSAYQRYLVKAGGLSDTEGAVWRLRLTPAGSGFDLSLVLGDPPRDPWS
jgi:hypothetical protein